jgi:hypothetical protein
MSGDASRPRRPAPYLAGDGDADLRRSNASDVRGVAPIGGSGPHWKAAGLGVDGDADTDAGAGAANGLGLGAAPGVGLVAFFAGSATGRRCREDGAVRREPCDGAGSASCGANTSSPGGGRLSDAASSSSPGGTKPTDADGDGASNLSVLGAGADEEPASGGVGAGEAAAGARRPPGRSRSSMLGGGGAERTEVLSSGSFRAARSACFSRCAERSAFSAAAAAPATAESAGVLSRSDRAGVAGRERPEDARFSLPRFRRAMRRLRDESSLESWSIAASTLFMVRAIISREDGLDTTLFSMIAKPWRKEHT